MCGHLGQPRTLPFFVSWTCNESEISVPAAFLGGSAIARLNRDLDVVLLFALTGILNSLLTKRELKHISLSLRIAC